MIQEEAHEDANIIFGAVIDPKMEGEVRITVIATGFGAFEERKLTNLKKTMSSLSKPVDDHDFPAYLRNEMNNEALEVTKVGTIVSEFVTDDYDIPTFLRNDVELEPSDA
jgi:cell division protein FtsZ